MRLVIHDEIALTEIRPSDKRACVERISDPEIHALTLRIPRPYTEAHFDKWLEIVAELARKNGELTHFAIRDRDTFIGAIGFTDIVRGHKAEIGYWLARDWWGRGIMTAVVGALCQHAFERWELVRISANVYAPNIASARVLEKNGFQCEGLLRKNWCKDGKFHDSRLFALVR